MTSSLRTLILRSRLAACFWLVAAGPTTSAMTVQIRDGRPVADGVYLNGHGPYRFLVDTGCSLNHLDKRVADEIGLGETLHTTLTSSTGAAAVSGGSGIEVALDSARAGNRIFLFAGLDRIQRTWPDVKGILGQDFLSHFDYLIDVRARKLEFGPHEFRGRAIRTAYRIDHGRPVVSTSLGWLVLDSGSPRLMRFGIEATRTTLEMRTLTGTAALGTVTSVLRIANNTFWRGDAIAIPHAAESAVDGMLPVSLFRSVYVSNSGGYIVFE